MIGARPGPFVHRADARRPPREPTREAQHTPYRAAML
jgi:hypothetical protein